ncbi:MAG: hypothetical protein IPF78_14230 [Flavobacteriales bacterium]|nr:hypothetical protein [Flavobacteriales bacterium]
MAPRREGLGARGGGWPAGNDTAENACLRGFPFVRFEESDAELDHAGDIDFLGHVGERAFGLQIKPVTAKANFGNYSPSDRMRARFSEFTQRFGGKVFIIYSLGGEVANEDVVELIEAEVGRLSA